MTNLTPYTGLEDRLNQVVYQLTECEREERSANPHTAGMPFYPDKHAWSWQCNGKKWVHINDSGGHGGAFLVDISTGELYNIQGYGRADHNKKAKADLGNIYTVDVKWLHTKRFNYLR